MATIATVMSDAGYSLTGSYGNTNLKLLQSVTSVNDNTVTTITLPGGGSTTTKYRLRVFNLSTVSFEYYESTSIADEPPSGDPYIDKTIIATWEV